MKKLLETMAAMAFRRGGEDLPEITEDDLVIVVVGAYSTIGKPTSKGSLAKGHKDYKDTRIVASSPGQWTWFQMSEAKGQHPSNRKVGIKLTVMLSTPQDAKAKKEAKSSAVQTSAII